MKRTKKTAGRKTIGPSLRITVPQEVMDWLIDIGNGRAFEAARTILETAHEKATGAKR